MTRDLPQSRWADLFSLASQSTPIEESESDVRVREEKRERGRERGEVKREREEERKRDNM